MSRPVRRLGGVSFRAADVALALALFLLPGVVIGVVLGIRLLHGPDLIELLHVVWAGGIVLLGLVAVIVLPAVAVSAGDARRRGRIWFGLAATLNLAALTWWLVLSLPVTVSLTKYLVVCVPTTVFGLFAYRRFQRNRRMPWAATLVAFAWGLAGATSAGSALLDPVTEVIQSAVTPGPAFQHVFVTVGAAVEEAVKAVGTLAVLLLFRERVMGLVGGLAVGAVVGVGFQFVESGRYMSPDAGGSPVYQLWTRQYVGMFTSHPLFSALVGAGLGLAFLQSRRLGKVLCGTCGYLAGFAGHALWNNASTAGLFVSVGDQRYYALLSHPLNVLIFTGPFLLLLSVLVVAGARFEVRGLLTELRSEAESGGAVRRDEVVRLVSARMRFRLRVRTLMQDGWAAYRRLAALHAAQLALGFTRWHRVRGEFVRGPMAEHELRAEIQELRPRPARAVRVAAIPFEGSRT